MTAGPTEYRKPSEGKVPIMATTQHAVPVVVVDSSDLDAALACKAAASLIPPHKNSEQLVLDLLDRLSRIRQRRELKGLNHWEEFAPAYLQKIVDKVEARRRRANDAFCRENHSRAMAFARAYLKNREEAEDAVSEAYVKLLSTETTAEHFMRTLKQGVLDRLKRSKIEARLFISLDRGLEDERRTADQEDL